MVCSTHQSPSGRQEGKKAAHLNQAKEVALHHFACILGCKLKLVHGGMNDLLHLKAPILQEHLHNGLVQQARILSSLTRGARFAGLVTYVRQYVRLPGVACNSASPGSLLKVVQC